MSFSIYTCAFKLDENDFDWRGALDNFGAFADEVVVAVPQDDGPTRDLLSGSGARVVACPLGLDDPLAVGKLKNAALKHTRYGTYKILLDLDERIPTRQKPKWERVADRYIGGRVTRAMLIPTIDLWGGVRQIKDDFKQYDKKFKWYLHDEGLSRGSPNFTRLEGGLVDITKTDTCELIDAAGNIIESAVVWDANVSDIGSYLEFLKGVEIYVFHLGYADLGRRLQLNKGFWAGYKKLRGGGFQEVPDVITDMAGLEAETASHGLPLWDE